jgi:hypothetical protein
MRPSIAVRGELPRNDGRPGLADCELIVQAWDPSGGRPRLRVWLEPENNWVLVDAYTLLEAVKAALAIAVIPPESWK